LRVFKASLFLSLSFLSYAAASACPFCSENLSKNNGGFGGGLTLGIVITIFLFLGVLATIVGLIVRSIREGDKRIALRRQLAQETISQA
jgi:hypothetical protein